MGQPKVASVTPVLKDLHGNQEVKQHEQKRQLTGEAAQALAERKEVFRDYENSQFVDRVKETYRLNHANQTFDFVANKKKQVLRLDRAKMTIWEAAELLDKLVDESDPDIGFGQIDHLLQTSEALREAYPEEDWLHLIGFIHDLGKVLAFPEFYNDPQWCVVGDTFPVGCAFSKKCVFPELFENNVDSKNEKFSTECGVYKPNCGLDNVQFSWGHDEYMYQVCVQNKCTLPPQALAIIRYHSFYPWHTYGAYDHLCSDADRANLKWVKEFQHFDLYSKTARRIDVASVKPYYLSLVDKYFGSRDRKLNW